MNSSGLSQRTEVSTHGFDFELSCDFQLMGIESLNRYDTNLLQGIAPGNLLAGTSLGATALCKACYRPQGVKQPFVDETHHTSVLLYTAPWKNNTPLSPTGALGGTSGRLDASQLCTSAMSKLPAGTAKSKL